jgi:hypothetical protein
LAKAPPTALWISTDGAPSSSRVRASAAATWAASPTSQTMPRAPAISRSSAASRSPSRASMATRKPPAANRRASAAPVPGPTPLISAIGSAIGIASRERSTQ